MEEMEESGLPRRPYVKLALAGLALTVAVVGAVTATRHHTHGKAAAPSPAPSVASETAGPASWAPVEPALPDDVTVSWAYLDSTEGSMLRGGDLNLHPLDQLVVPGIAEDRLDRAAGDRPSSKPGDTTLLAAALAGNHDAGADLVAAAGGVNKVFPRIIDECQLPDTRMGPPQATSLDVARYAACLREGAITDPDRAGWARDQMRHTAGGIGDVRGNDGGQRLAQFNSTATAGAGRMRTGCLGVGAYWSAAVLVDWPVGRGRLYGEDACAEVARVEFPPDTQRAPDMPAPAQQPSA
jgi:hypothetical protein